MLLPVVMVSPSEVWQSFLHSHLEEKKRGFLLLAKENSSKYLTLHGFCWQQAEKQSHGTIIFWKVGDYTYFNGLCVIQVSTQVHQQLGHPDGNVIRAGENTSTEAENTRMTPHQVYKNITGAFPLTSYWLYQHIVWRMTYQQTVSCPL